ncbi:MAG: helix-turn-helix domain-containing protein [Ferrimicrobium sp.]
MTTIDVITRYNEALEGGPLERAIPCPTVDTTMPIWMIGDWRVSLPQSPPELFQGIKQIASDLQRWTGWSARHLADVLGTSHTTIRAITNGRPIVDGHSGDLRRRLVETHNVVERIYLLAECDSGKVNDLLDTPKSGRKTVAAELQAGQFARAYLVAIDILRPSKLGLITGDRPKRDDAVVPLHD